jgi:hypothetical protein
MKLNEVRAIRHGTRPQRRLINEQHTRGSLLTKTIPEHEFKPVNATTLSLLFRSAIALLGKPVDVSIPLIRVCTPGLFAAEVRASV